jgi:2-hydroxychromene-2-carboxylate isomerase
MMSLLMSDTPCEFFYDFSSPYSYLAALRVDDLLPVRPRWRPIAFGAIVQQIGKVPWSFGTDRSADFKEIERRAHERCLPHVRYPRGWPRETYSLTPLRAALVADEIGLLRELSRELFQAIFVEGHDFTDLETTLSAAERAGIERTQMDAGVGRQDIKDRLRAATDQAIERGVTGVPTVAVGDELFWGDDRLEDAADAIASAR